MARHNKYGELDDIPTEGMDIGFKGFNNRLRPDQLPLGVLAESINGRFDINGEWQTRKGIQVRLAPFTSNGLTLPFYCYGDHLSSSMSGVTTNLITINFAAPHAFVDQTLAYVDGITGVTPTPEGNYTVTVTSTTQITIDVGAATGTAGGTATVGAPALDDTAVAAIYGTASFYDDAGANAPYILLAGNTACIAFNVATDATTEISYPSITVIDDVVMKQYDNQIYMFRDGLTPLVWDGVLTGSPAFVAVTDGAYVQPVELPATGYSVTNGVATVTVTHSLSVGDTVTLVAVGSSGLMEQDKFVISSVSGTASFNFYVSSQDISNQTDVVFIREVSSGGGYTYLPAPPWAEVHQSRIVCPHNYDITGTAGSPTITDRIVRDELIFSLVSDANTCDYIRGKFKFMNGKSDFLIGVHSFSDDKLVVFTRESVHLITDSLDLKTSVVTLLTNDLGCIARESIQQVGSLIIFLSDNGVYALDFEDLYNLRGRDMPLSEKINPSIKRINFDYADKAQGVYFDNRYYLAVPIDGALKNNAVFIFNFLNKEWESIDTVDDERWDYLYLVIAGIGSTRGVYVVNRRGGIHKLDNNDTGTDAIISEVGGSQQLIVTPSIAVSRSYTGSTMDRKTWKRWEAHIESSTGTQSDANLSVITENVDDTLPLGSIKSLHGSFLSQGQDISMRGRIGSPRSYGIQFKLESTQGRPKIRALKIAGNKAFRSTNEAI